MIVKGLIKSVDFNGNTCNVRIPVFESANNNSEVCLNANIATTPGIYNSYKAGDVVYVAFENNTIENPIVFGKLYLGAAKEQNDPRGTVNCDNISSTTPISIPIDTKLTLNNDPNNLTTVGVEGDLATYKSIADIAKGLQHQEEQIGSMSIQIIDTGEGLGAKVDKKHDDGSEHGFGWDLTDRSWKVYSYDSTHTWLKDIGILNVDNSGVQITGELKILDYPKKKIEAYYYGSLDIDTIKPSGGIENAATDFSKLKTFWHWDTEEYPGQIHPDFVSPKYGTLNSQTSEVAYFDHVWKLACEITYAYKESDKSLVEIVQNITYENLQELDTDEEPIITNTDRPKTDTALVLVRGKSANYYDSKEPYKIAKGSEALLPTDKGTPGSKYYFCAPDLKDGDCWFDISDSDRRNTNDFTISGAESENWTKREDSTAWPNVDRFDLADSTFNNRYRQNAGHRGNATVSKGTWYTRGGFTDINTLTLCFKDDTVQPQTLVILIPKTDGINTVSALKTWLSNEPITIVYETTNTAKNILKQCTGFEQTGTYANKKAIWEDIGGEIVTNKLTANYINALEISAKKIEVFDSNNNTLFKANGLPGETDANKVRVAGFVVDDNSLISLKADGTKHNVGESGSVVVCKGSRSSANIAGAGNNADGWIFTGGNNFGVRLQGYKSDGTTAVSIHDSTADPTKTKSELYVNRGKIANFTIGDDSNNSNQTGGPYLKYNTPGTANSVLVSPGYKKNINTLVDATKTWAFTAGQNFGVSTDGVLYANSLYATNGGQLGPLKIGSSGLGIDDGGLTTTYISGNTIQTPCLVIGKSGGGTSAGNFRITNIPLYNSNNTANHPAILTSQSGSGSFVMATPLDGVIAGGVVRGKSGQGGGSNLYMLDGQKLLLVQNFDTDRPYAFTLPAGDTNYVHEISLSPYLKQPNQYYGGVDEIYYAQILPFTYTDSTVWYNPLYAVYFALNWGSNGTLKIKYTSKLTASLLCHILIWCATSNDMKIYTD